MANLRERSAQNTDTTNLRLTMFERLQGLLGKESVEESVSPADIARDINALHQSMDEMKQYSLDTMTWLADEQERLEEEGETEIAEELDDLMLYVQTVFLRIEYGDQSVRPDAEEKIEEAGESVDDVLEAANDSEGSE
ncbi:hypothetical protein RBH26_20845 [Natronolimnohabitans sp. A-GB9]|uniref:hypothetical protein n=1 Tax=Natronolimnohabitans sp. A-GB9 TaxID=3069757 RepID=UPI0027ADFB30|nr:hypothetical protein [Natronolimnohabitans sp. A-GB9]MDQ2052893.1 hypothetical protein [Natronolimnohabitans sp. A-GB9]